MHRNHLKIAKNLAKKYFSLTEKCVAFQILVADKEDIDHYESSLCHGEDMVSWTLHAAIPYCYVVLDKDMSLTETCVSFQLLIAGIEDINHYESSLCYCVDVVSGTLHAAIPYCYIVLKKNLNNIFDSRFSLFVSNTCDGYNIITFHVLKS